MSLVLLTQVANLYYFSILIEIRSFFSFFLFTHKGIEYKSTSSWHKVWLCVCMCAPSVQQKKEKQQDS